MLKSRESSKISRSSIWKNRYHSWFPERESRSNSRNKLALRRFPMSLWCIAIKRRCGMREVWIWKLLMRLLIRFPSGIAKDSINTALRRNWFDLSFSLMKEVFVPCKRLNMHLSLPHNWSTEFTESYEVFHRHCWVSYGDTVLSGIRIFYYYLEIIRDN